MKTNVYESAVLINAALEDDQIQQIISRIKDQISNNGGKIREIEDWGRRRLAYLIKKSKLGYYAIFRFDAPPDLISKLERAYKLDEQVFRYLTIKLDDDALEHIQQNMKKAREEEEAANQEDSIESKETEEDSEEAEEEK